MLTDKFHDDRSLVANMPLMRRALFSGKNLDRTAPLIDALREIAAAHSATPTQVALAAPSFHRCPGQRRSNSAIAVPDVGREKLVAIIEVKKRGESPEEAADKLAVVKREVMSAISNSHGLAVADLVMVVPGSIPITTSGKVRRAACVEQYRNGQFARLDAF
jgi:acyl-CoA synthetase (AMP-forming)/AMP-acid ligase II